MLENSDEEHAREHRPRILEIRDDIYDSINGSFAAAKWPIPFEDDDIEIQESEMWYNT